jgi:hypothetical protein
MTVHRAGVRALAILLTVAGAAVLIGAVHAPPQGGIIVQVRDFTGAATVDVVAWTSSDPTFGLRTFVRRAGGPDRYHRLWVNIDVAGVRDVAKAQGFDRPLRVSTETDAQNCYNGKCSPTSTVGARMFDEQLRSSKGDVVVKFITPTSSEIDYTLRRALIDAYLATVDSVAKALKK